MDFGLIKYVYYKNSTWLLFFVFVGEECRLGLII